MKPRFTDIVQQAFRIADGYMISILESETVWTADSTRLGLTRDDCTECESFAEAGAAIREAYEWLSSRGLAELEKDEHGEYIVLLEEGSEPQSAPLVRMRIQFSEGHCDSCDSQHDCDIAMRCLNPPISAGNRSKQQVSAVPCARCGGPCIEFTVPNDVWNSVVRLGGKERDDEYICEACYRKAVEAWVRLVRPVSTAF